MKKPLRIAFIVNRFPSVSETFILNQITDIMARAHDVAVFSFEAGDTKVVHQAFLDYGLAEKTTYYKPPRNWYETIFWVSQNVLNAVASGRVRECKAWTKSAIYQVLKREALISALRRFLRINSFDIVHAHFGQRGAVVADTMTSGSAFKLITSFHGYDLNPDARHVNSKRYCGVFARSSAVTVNSIYLKELLLQLNLNPKRIVLLPEGLKTEQYSSNGIREESNAFRILYCGRFVEFKGPDLAVRILAILVNERGLSNVSLSMIGLGPMKQSVERLAREIGIHNHVTFLGALSQEMVIKEMAQSHVFLLPGVYERQSGRAEAQGLVVQEAQSMCLPVVTSDAGGARYGLVENVTGFVLKAGNLGGFADKIELLVKDPALRTRMGAAGRKYVIENFDSKILGDQLEKIYWDILS